MLALDTSNPIGSVAIAEAGVVVARAVLTRQAAHASGLIPAIDEVLTAAGLTRDRLVGLVVGEGPGSFTGVRVAAATAKGLSTALGRPLWAISSLAAAAMVGARATIRYALFDARAERVYGACYGVGSFRVETLVEPHGAELRDLLDDDVPGGAVFCGNAAERHRALIEGAGFEVARREDETSLADGLVEYMARCPGHAPVEDVGSWEPEYVRVSSAERLWKT
ncbi:MAG: tRNA (adenosine(37)-N6)-threonylcarbamoyltransferase complex dimerization subunit type 1 TsaB [Gemmatimonadota bacterium]|nr:tRNA (adenosine(37)-N6)-threonylcarbamoyltransferase complex dimerization subunit type 1 TsaB [Gemmatimonadota bacterium]